jgi:hypothetical protein
MEPADAAPILAVGAECREFSGLLRLATSVSKLSWPIAFARRILLSGRTWLLAANGPGPRLAAEAAQAAVRNCRPSAVLSTGLCGALDPAIPVQSIFVATEVRSSARVFPACIPAQPCNGFSGPLLTQDRVAVTAAEKAVLFASGARAVDMEAAAVASQAERLGIPFYCVRVISDEAGYSLPLDFNRYRDATGRFSRLRIALAAVTRPAVVAPLMRFDSVCRRSAILLGESLADCRF